MSNKYTKQVSRSQYQDQDYDNFSRFVSYYNQKELVFNAAKHKREKVLEIGAGTGFLKDYLTKRGLRVKTFDIAEDLEPDYIGDITQLSKIVKEKFDIICCFEVLEHIRFEDVDKALREISKVSTNYVIISIPQISLHLGLTMKLPKIKVLGFLFMLPFPIKHKFDGQHYWELGKKGYKYKKFKILLNKYFDVENDFIDPLDPYHHYFICKK